MAGEKGGREQEKRGEREGEDETEIQGEEEGALSLQVKSFCSSLPLQGKWSLCSCPFPSCLLLQHAALPRCHALGIYL